MRKIDPEGIWKDFKDQLGEQALFHSKVRTALTQANEQKIAAENYTLTVGVLFEGFINDMIFAYANRDCSQIMIHLKNSILETLKPNQKAALAFSNFGDFKSANHITKDQLKSILDPTGRNTAFPNYAAIESRAN